MTRQPRNEQPRNEQQEETVVLTQSALEEMIARAAQAGAEAGANAANAAIRKSESRASRKTRAQEQRGADEIHETYDDLWSEPLLLDATKIKPRPGYVQHWVRTLLDNQPDHGNVAKQMNRGWRPRSADSVPKGVMIPKVNFEDFTNVVGVHGMILMERKKEEDDRYRRGIQARTRAQMEAVDSNLMREHVPGKGFGRPQISRQSKITRGVPNIRDDA